MRSEDYAHTTRFHFQRDLVACLSGSALAGAPHSRAGQVGAAREAALIASGGARPTVVLRPTSRSKDVQDALELLAPGGPAPSLAAAVKLALVGAGGVSCTLSRPLLPAPVAAASFLPPLPAPLPATCLPTIQSASAAALLQLLAGRYESARVVAFLGSRPRLGREETEDLRARLQQSQAEQEVGAQPRVRLDVAVLCMREELGAEAEAALELLGGSGAASSSSSSDGSTCTAAGPASCRVLWVSPRAGALDLWQQLEGAQELLDPGSPRPMGMGPMSPGRGGGSSSSSPGGGSSSGGTEDSRSSRPGRPLRLAAEAGSSLRAPRVPLLAARSGLAQATSCRHDSLDWLGHLSTDGGW